MEHKTFPQITKTIDNRTVIGIAAVHGNIDEGGDRSFNGSFANITVDGRDRAVFLWQHNSYDPPIATIKAVRELTRADLPTEVLGYAPDATGGVEVTREYLDTPRGNEVLTGIKSGAIREMSYAYDATRATYEEVDGQQIRNILEVKIFDFSDVCWGMNNATLTSKGIPVPGMPFLDYSDWMVSALEEYIRRAKNREQFRAKEGRTFSAANVTRLQTIHDGLVSASDDLKALLDSTAPKSVDTAAIRLALLEFERTRARQNGVHL